MCVWEVGQYGGLHYFVHGTGVLIWCLTFKPGLGPDAGHTIMAIMLQYLSHLNSLFLMADIGGCIWLKAVF